MSTIERARADRSRDNLNQSIEHSQQARGDLRAQNAQKANRTGIMGTVLADGVEAHVPEGATVTSATAPGMTATTTGPNPFVAFKGTNAPSALLAAPVPMDAEVGPELSQLLAMGAFELAASQHGDARVKAGTEKVSTGTKLVIADDEGVFAEQLGEAHESAQTMALNFKHNKSALEAADKRASFVSQQAHLATGSMPAGMSIDAYVQSVLRESYQLQTDIVGDIAAQLDAANQQRKESRDRAMRLRELKSKLAKSGLTDAELEELAALGVTLDEKTIGSIEADFEWEKDAELAALEKELEALSESAPAKPPADAPPAPIVYKPSYDASVAAPFSPVTPPAESAVAEVFAFAVKKFAQANEKDKSEDRYKKKYDHLNGARGALTESVKQAGTRPSSEIQALIDVAMWAIKKGKDVAENTEFIKTALGAMTRDQLEEFKSSNNKLWGEVNGSVENLAESRLQQINRLRDGGLNAPPGPVNDALQAIAVASASGWQSPQMDLALSKMYGLSGTDAALVLNKLTSGLDPKIESENFDKFVLACNPSALLQGADPKSLEFLKNMGGQAQAVFDKWANAQPPEAPPAAPDVSTLTPEEKEARKQELTEDIAALKGERSAAVASANQDALKSALSDMIDNAVTKLEGQTEDAGDDIQMLQMRLQEAMQNRQQYMQMMSNLSKMMHDTIMSIIRNMGG